MQQIVSALGRFAARLPHPAVMRIKTQRARVFHQAFERAGAGKARLHRL